jgi:hypothetical protein
MVGAHIYAERQSPFCAGEHRHAATVAEDGTFEIHGFDAEVAEVHIELHNHEPDGRESYPTETMKFTVRPGDPPIEFRLGTTK